jgi:hypothetical protein
VGWQQVFLDYAIFGLAFDVNGNFWTIKPGGGHLNFFRYEGHEPPLEGEWRYEQFPYPPAPLEDCHYWSSNSRFQSTQECRALAAWQHRLDLLTLPAERIDPFFPQVVAGKKSMWLFGFNSHLRPGHSELHVLLRWSDERAGGNGWQVMPFPFALGKVNAMVADGTRSGVWIGSIEGLYFSDGHTARRVSLASIDSIPIGPFVSRLTLDNAGRLWVATSEGLLRYDDEADRWQPTAIRGSVFITPDDRGGLWTLSGETEGKVSYFDGVHWQHHAASVGWRCNPIGIAADAGGGLWMMSACCCCLLGFDGQQWTPYSNGRDICGKLIRDSNGELYVTSSKTGLWRYDGVNWENLLPAGHPNAEIRTWVADQKGGLWISYWRRPHLRHFSPAIGDLVPATGDLSEGQWREFPDLVGIHALFVNSRGDLWVGGERELLRYDGENWQRVPASDWVIALVEDWEGRIWFSDMGELYVYEPSGE